MANFSVSTLRRSIFPALGLICALPVLAGTPEDTADPRSAAAAWEEAVGHLAGSAADPQALLARVRREGSLPVIVQVRESDEERGGPPDEVRERRDARRAAILARVGLPKGQDRAGHPVKSFASIGGFAMRADALDVLTLADDPEVEAVSEDVPYPPALLESVPLTGGLGGAYAGYTGAGPVVAVLDTGVDKTHPMLAGKVVSEACYSTANATTGVTSLCPGGVSASTAAGAAVPCSSTWGAECAHGTHVAGIAAGNGSTYTGVAKDAQVIAVQVFSGFPAASCGGTSPCVMAYTSDIIRGLERVYALRTSYAIAAANLSLGGGNYTTNCDGDAAKPAIDDLRTAGIATVVASGNSGYTSGISSPACISSAVSVGASCDAAGSYCAALDAVASYSNSAAFLSLLAPGSAITSAVPGGTTATWHGTSMATPHVTGAWAVLKEVRATAGVAEVLNVLRSTGKAVTDARNGLTVPRIQVAAAADLLNDAPVVVIPAAPTLSAATAITKTGFQANWKAVTGATGYRLEVATNNKFTSMVAGYNGLDVGAALSRLVSGLKAGTNYFVRVRAYNSAGTGPVSATLTVKTLR